MIITQIQNKSLHVFFINKTRERFAPAEGVKELKCF